MYEMVESEWATTRYKYLEIDALQKLEWVDDVMHLFKFDNNFKILLT